jgi:uncharacterized membrane protein (Fun14 family)
VNRLSIETATNLTPFLSSVGFGGIIGFLVGFMLKKVMKILAVVAGVFFAALLYLQSQGILNIHWDKLQITFQGIVSTITAALTTLSAGGSMSIPGIVLPTTMTSLGIPLTTGSAAMGFTIGFMKG